MTELDFHHLNTVCARLAESGGITGPIVAQTPDAVRVAALSAADVRRLRAGLIRTGYDAHRIRRFGSRSELMVSGWSRRALAKRINTLRTEIDRLAGARRDTAAAAVARAADLREDSGTTSRTAGAHGVDRPADVRASAEHRLRHEVEAYAGIIAPVDLRAGHTDADTLRLLRTVERLERQALDRINHHAITAGLAVQLYTRYRRHTNDELARTAAVHDAYFAGRQRTASSTERRVRTALPALEPASDASEHMAVDRTNGVAAAARDFPARATDAADTRPSRAEPRPPDANGPGMTTRRAR